MTIDEIQLLIGGINATGMVVMATGVVALFVRGDIVTRSTAEAIHVAECEKILDEIREWRRDFERQARMDNTD